MNTQSMNQKMKEFINSIYNDINRKDYKSARNKIEQLTDITIENHPEVIMTNMELKRRMCD